MSGTATITPARGRGLSLNVDHVLSDGERARIEQLCAEGVPTPSSLSELDERKQELNELIRKARMQAKTTNDQDLFKKMGKIFQQRLSLGSPRLIARAGRRESQQRELYLANVRMNIAALEEEALYCRSVSLESFKPWFETIAHLCSWNADELEEKVTMLWMPFGAINGESLGNPQFLLAAVREAVHDHLLTEEVNTSSRALALAFGIWNVSKAKLQLQTSAREVGEKLTNIMFSALDTRRDEMDMAAFTCLRRSFIHPLLCC